jgi:hypothetical protein
VSRSLVVIAFANACFVWCCDPVGAPIALPRVDSPSDAVIDEWHSKYVTCLTELFNAHKHKYGHGDSDLTVH